MTETSKTVVIEEISEVGEKRWNRVVNESREGTFFHSFKWNLFLEEFGKISNSYSPKHILVENDEIQAILPLFLTRDKILFSLPTGDYGGPCIAPDVQPRLILGLLVEKVLEIYRKHARQIHLKSVSQKYVQDFYNQGFERQKFMTTFLIQVKDCSIDDLEKKWRRDTKRSIKRARSKNVEVEIISREEFLKNYYEIYDDTMRRLKASRHPYSFFKVLWKYLYKQDFLLILLARHENRYVAGLIYFIYDSAMHIYGNVSLSDALSLRANDLLYYETIRQGLQSNCQVIDFGQTTSDETSGLYQFKKKWGGVPKTLIHIQKTSIREKTLLKLKYLVSRFH